MTEMDEFDPPFSACVGVTTRGQTPALMLKTPEKKNTKNVHVTQKAKSS